MVKREVLAGWGSLLLNITSVISILRKYGFIHSFTHFLPLSFPSLPLSSPISLPFLPYFFPIFFNPSNMFCY